MFLDDRLALPQLLLVRTVFLWFSRCKEREEKENHIDIEYLRSFLLFLAESNSRI